MNDFTKEELQIVHLDMTTYVNSTPMLRESPSHKALRDKIQAMLDNYCEHKDCITANDCPMCKVKELRCNHCGDVHYEGLE